MATQSPRIDDQPDSPSRDEVLKRMLKMKPMPHVPTAKKRKAGKKPGKVVSR